MSFAHRYHYPRASALEPRSTGVGCLLVGDHDGLFRGLVAQPRRVAVGLRTIGRTATSRFYLPPNVIAHLQDPIATVAREAVRFESFSGCCSTYARLDLDEQAFDRVDERTPGTTNVDFQAPMLAALARVRDDTEMAIEVGRTAVAVSAGDEQVVERKVPFPVRWLKGLGEVQAYLARMQPRFTLPRAEALRFVRSLPATTRHETYVEPLGRGVRVTQRKSADAVRVHGVERLRLLTDLLPDCDGLRVYADPFGASAWQATLGPATLTLVLSPERWRGFSGEGQLLSTLATADADDVLARVRAQLRWQDRIDIDALADVAGVEPATAREAIAMLASRGLVGFDLRDGSWFHRELPFDLSRVEALHPRLQDARKLVAAGAVTSTRDGATVRSGDADYHITLSDEPTCTCPWFAQHQHERGPCKHVLAAQISAHEAAR